MFLFGKHGKKDPKKNGINRKSGETEDIRKTERKTEQVPLNAADAAGYEELANKIFPGMAMYARDVDLKDDFAGKYVPGMIIREKAFVDASSRFMGMVTTHRYVILSNHMFDASGFEHGTGWGLCIANKDAHFKVLKIHRFQGKTGIFLLHLPDGDLWKEYEKVHFPLEDQVLEMAIQRFEAKVTGPVVPELATKEWLDHCAFPLGMNDMGELWELEDGTQNSTAPEQESSASAETDLSDSVYRYYRHEKTGHLLKVNRKNPSEFYRMHSYSKAWLEDSSMGAEFAYGEIIGYNEISLKDTYVTAEDLQKPGYPAQTDFYIGQSPACDICLKDEQAAQKHACFNYGVWGWTLFSLEDNDFILNGKRTKTDHLKNGDRIQIGSAEIEFCDTYLRVREEGEERVLCFPSDAALKGSFERLKKSRYLGCLLGGAAGDALGYPVEFKQESEIFSLYGDKGIRTLEQAGTPAVISDDTQMTLFAANGMLFGRSNSCSDGLIRAYQEWLATQGDDCCIREDPVPRMWIYSDRRLHARRAPGNTCIFSLKETRGKKDFEPAKNDSKGCGTVMRAAPFGLIVKYDRFSRGDDTAGIRKYAVYDAKITHGHQMAACASADLACIIYNIVQHDTSRCAPLQDTVLSSPLFLEELIQKAIDLALDKSITDLDGIHALGEGWVAEEALAIAVFCAVRYQDDFASAVCASVNHKGDSDSTGALCGSIMGAWLGQEAVRNAFDLENLELADIVSTIAEDLFTMTGSGVPDPGKDPKWDRKYRIDQ